MYAIELDIRRTLERSTRLRATWLVGLPFAALAGYLIYGDLSARASIGEVVFWSLGWCLLFTTSAGVVNVGRFYATFADHLHEEADCLYVSDPTRSSLLRSVIRWANGC